MFTTEQNIEKINFLQNNYPSKCNALSLCKSNHIAINRSSNISRIVVRQQFVRQTMILHLVTCYPYFSSHIFGRRNTNANRLTTPKLKQQGRLQDKRQNILHQPYYLLSFIHLSICQGKSNESTLKL